MQPTLSDMMHEAVLGACCTCDEVALAFCEDHSTTIAL